MSSAVNAMLFLAACVITTSASAQSEMDKEIRGKKQRVVENGLLSASACRTYITEAFQTPSMKFAANSMGGCEKVAPAGYAIRTTASGAITVFYNSGGEGVRDRAIALVPLVGGQPARGASRPAALSGWRCGNPRDVPDGSKLPDKEYLPKNCGVVI